jgi:hypothetical protein
VKGNELPEGMDAETTLEQGREIVAMLNAGDWQGVYDRMRPDSQETTSPEAIQAYMEALLDKVGPYESEKETMTTGQTLKDTGEEYGTAVIYCKHQKKNVMYRIAFSTDMELMGLEAIKK